MFKRLRNLIKLVLILSVLFNKSSAFAGIEDDKTNIEGGILLLRHIINDELCDKQLSSFMEALTIREYWAVKCKIPIECQTL